MEESSIDEINASLEIIPTMEQQNDEKMKTYPTIKCIEDVEKILNKLL